MLPHRTRLARAAWVQGVDEPIVMKRGPETPCPILRKLLGQAMCLGYNDPGSNAGALKQLILALGSSTLSPESNLASWVLAMTLALPETIAAEKEAGGSGCQTCHAVLAWFIPAETVR